MRGGCGEEIVIFGCGQISGRELMWKLYGLHGAVVDICIILLSWICLMVSLRVFEGIFGKLPRVQRLCQRWSGV